MHTNILRVALAAHVLLGIGAQVAKDTDRFYELFEEGVDILEEQIQDHPDVRFEFDPSKKLLPADGYSFEFPDIEDYRIGILMDPVCSKRCRQYLSSLLVLSLWEYSAEAIAMTAA